MSYPFQAEAPPGELSAQVIPHRVPPYRTHPTRGLHRFTARAMVLQMFHDGRLPGQDHLHALHAAVRTVGEDRRLRSELSAGRMGGEEDQVY